MTIQTLPRNLPAAPPRAGTVPASTAAEWLKLRSLRSTWWFLGGSAVIVLLMALLESDDGDPTTVSAVPVVMSAVNYFVQYVLAGFGIVTITGEYASRSITVTMACTPSRTRILAAKALVVLGTVFVTGLVVTGLGVLVTAVRMDEVSSLGASQAADAARMSLYLALLAVFALGVGTLVRRTAGALAIVVLLLLMVPELLRMLSERVGLSWINTVGDYTPSPAGYRLMAGDWESGLVLCAWAVAAICAGVWAMRTRDA
jgi:ABC-2 type transport system permease protein